MFLFLFLLFLSYNSVQNGGSQIKVERFHLECWWCKTHWKI